MRACRLASSWVSILGLMKLSSPTMYYSRAGLSSHLSTIPHNALTRLLLSPRPRKAHPARRNEDAPHLREPLPHTRTARATPAVAVRRRGRPCRRRRRDSHAPRGRLEHPQESPHLSHRAVSALSLKQKVPIRHSLRKMCRFGTQSTRKTHHTAQNALETEEGGRQTGASPQPSLRSSAPRPTLEPAVQVGAPGDLSDCSTGPGAAPPLLPLR